jgi:hypothetical protein
LIGTPQSSISSGGLLLLQKVKKEEAYCNSIVTVLHSEGAAVTTNAFASSGFIPNKENFIIQFKHLYNKESKKPKTIRIF